MILSMNHFREIAYLTDIAKPDVGVIIVTHHLREDIRENLNKVYLLGSPDVYHQNTEKTTA